VSATTGDVAQCLQRDPVERGGPRGRRLPSKAIVKLVLGAVQQLHRIESMAQRFPEPSRSSASGDEVEH
jgi:hypothetical protein